MYVMTKYLMNDRLYIRLWVVAKNESYNLKNNKTHTIADDNWFDWKVWKLIWRCYCRLIPKLYLFNIPKDRIWFEFWWFIWNFEITYYHKK